MKLPEDMARAIGTELRRIENLHSRTTAVLMSPKGHPPERLEDLLNELQDAAYNARSALEPGRLT